MRPVGCEALTQSVPLAASNGAGKGTETPRELDFGGQWDLITELPQDWGDRETDSWRAQTEPYAHQDPGERSSVPTRDGARFAHEGPGVSCRGVGRQGLLRGQGRVHTTGASPCEGGRRHCHGPCHSLA